MKTKSSKKTWIILGLIALAIFALTFSTCFNTTRTFDTSEFDEIVEMMGVESGSEGKGVVSKEEIRKNEYNLNIPRYVDSSEPSDVHDIYAVEKKIFGLTYEKV